MALVRNSIPLNPKYPDLLIFIVSRSSRVRGHHARRGPARHRDDPRDRGRADQVHLAQAAPARQPRVAHRAHHRAHRGRDRRAPLRRVRVQRPALRPRGRDGAHARPARADDHPAGGQRVGGGERDGGEE